MSERAAGYGFRIASLRYPKASAMELSLFIEPETTSDLGLAIVMSSNTPLILLDEALVVRAASLSFCSSFSLDSATVVGAEVFALGNGEWDIPQLRSLLTSTASGRAAIDCYEMDLKRDGEPTRCLLVNAHVLDQPGDPAVHLVMAVTDVTEARQAAREMDALAQEKNVLLQELHHRVANSLQIIASVLMQRVRRVQSEETRSHLRDAHNRVMAVATLQRQLASRASGDVALRPYFTELCASIGASMILDPELMTITVEADDSTTTADRSVSLGLIITELVINSLKHAFPDVSAKGAITIGFNATPEGWTLTVADDGVGIAAQQGGAEPGLGTGIVNALAAQLPPRSK
jgi:two-component sensor histidine kinase